MTGRIFTLLALLIAFAAVAQQTPPGDVQKPVAVVNGQTITAKQLDQLYERIGTQMRNQYDKNGGKAALLENYLRKRLVIQEALKAGFDKRPDVQADMEAARESMLFDRYIRDVIAAKIVNEAAERAYYEQHPDDFVTPEKIHVRHIVITAQAKQKGQALDIIKQVAAALHEQNMAARAAGAAAEQLRINQFGQLAQKYSEDASAQSGGDLGWVARGQLDPDFENAAFALSPGTPSGIVETKFGYHIILVEAKQPAGKEPFDEAKPKIREFLLTTQSTEVMQAVEKLMNELRANSKVTIYPENIK